MNFHAHVGAAQSKQDWKARAQADRLAHGGGSAGRGVGLLSGVWQSADHVYRPLGYGVMTVSVFLMWIGNMVREIGRMIVASIHNRAA